MHEKHNSAVWVAVGMLLLIVLLSAYVAGYFLREQSVGIHAFGLSEYRIYPTRWEATLFYPAAKIESAITGVPTSTGYLE